MPRPSASITPSVLFVCTGNICRSPTGHALLVHKAQAASVAVIVDSAAVSDEERGNPVDRRAAAELRRRGVPLRARTARQVRREDFARFDRIVGMTRAHCAALRGMAPPAQAQRVALMMDFAPGHAGVDVPDPWYGDAEDFVRVFDLIDRAVDGLLLALSQRTFAARAPTRD